MNKKGFIFDFDGVILDTEKYHYEAWAYAFRMAGAKLDVKEYEPMKSVGRDYIITYIEKRDDVVFSKEQRIKIVADKDEKYIELKKNLSLNDEIKGVLSYIDYLKSKGVKTAVASSSVEAGNTVKQFGLQDKFDFVVDGMFGLKRKPNPDMFLYAVKKLGLSVDDCVVFEDSYAGIKASNNADIDCVYIGQTENENALFTIKDFDGFKKMNFDLKT